MADRPGVSQSYGNGAVNAVEQQRLAVLAAGGYAGATGVPTGAPGVVSLGRRPAIDPADRKFYNRPGVMDQYKASAAVPIDRAYAEYMYLTPEELGEWRAEVSRGLTWDVAKNPQTMQSEWNRTITELSNYQAETKNYDIGPLEFRRMQNDRLVAAGIIDENKWRGGGGGGGYSGPTTQYQTDRFVDLTNPTEAEGLLNQTLQNYLGRNATREELDTFYNTLSGLQKENPVVTSSVSKSSGGGKPTVKQSNSGQRSGGVDPATIAEQFARSRDEAAETLMGGQYMDWFMQKLVAPEQGGLTSGL